METKLFLKAYAKLNLLLDVLCKRPDGYHELEGIMCRVSLADDITLEPADGITVESDLPLPYSNTCRRAAEAFLGGSGRGVVIKIVKRIPSEAGMGGASADAAAVLLGLNELYRDTELARTEAELMELGLKVGADVPFCLLGGFAAARGVGERLEPLPGFALPVLAVRGSRGVSTGALFKSLGVGPDKRSRLTEGAMERAVNALYSGSAHGLCREFGNALQPSAEKLAPEIGEYVERMRKAGAVGACMTGSGAAVFGIFDSAEAAENAKAAFTDCEFASVCRTVPGYAPVVIRFRRARESDAALTAELRRRAWLTTYRGIYPDALLDEFDSAGREARDRNIITSPTAEAFVIEADGKPCGFVFLDLSSGLYVAALYILSEYRGFGIGSLAFSLIRDICLERGLDRFTCRCNTHNAPALAFYARMGGRELGRTEGHENKREDLALLEFDV
ncbi:MAG: 4-(cytidine 5'-diphospho)-2-C-methyl-D-erythritol kinase [Clostridia bacterium]|nr:4-(cytidine 5'-diphospho)-2-C-methyl-D-erythritol kinase [Clostridia bacterium]